MELQRITTQYDPAEDRIRLTGTDGQDQSMCLWFTQKFLNLLVLHLCETLEKRMNTSAGQQASHSVHTHVVQSFAQQKARAALSLRPPVVPAADAAHWRVDSVDVRHAVGGVRLIFKGSIASQEALLTLPDRTLRQWLGIVFDQYRRAAWATQAWPIWMEEAAAASTVHEHAGVLH